MRLSHAVHRAPILLGVVFATAVSIAAWSGVSPVSSSPSDAYAQQEPSLDAAPDPAQQPTSDLQSSAPEPGAGPSCTYDEAKGIVDDFLAAYNGGDVQAAAQFFGPKFKWFSATNRVSGEPNFVSYQPDGAVEYVRGRFARGEQLLLTEFHLADPSGAPEPRDLVNFWYRLDRVLDGTTFAGMGKGALDCDNREIFVWSMGDCEQVLALTGRCLGQ